MSIRPVRRLIKAKPTIEGAGVHLRRAFGFGHRRDHFDLLRERARGFTPARHRQVQHQLDWRSRCGHETSELLALSFNPSSGPFGPSVAKAAYYALC